MVEAVRKARQKLNKISKESASKQSEPQIIKDESTTTSRDTEWVPKQGESVYLPSIQAHAVVEKIGPGSQVTLRKGILTMQATIGQLQKAP